MEKQPRGIPEATETHEITKQPTLFDKLAGIMQDPELASQIGGLIINLKLPSLKSRGYITKEQSNDLLDMHDNAIKSLLTPEQIEKADREAMGRINEVSEFVHMR